MATSSGVFSPFWKFTVLLLFYQVLTQWLKDIGLVKSK